MPKETIGDMRMKILERLGQLTEGNNAIRERRYTEEKAKIKDFTEKSIEQAPLIQAIQDKGKQRVELIGSMKAALSALPLNDQTTISKAIKELETMGNNEFDIIELRQKYPEWFIPLDRIKITDIPLREDLQSIGAEIRLQRDQLQELQTLKDIEDQGQITRNQLERLIQLQQIGVGHQRKLDYILAKQEEGEMLHAAELQELRGLSSMARDFIDRTVILQEDQINELRRLQAIEARGQLHTEQLDRLIFLQRTGIAQNERFHHLKMQFELGRLSPGELDELHRLRELERDQIRRTERAIQETKDLKPPGAVDRKDGLTMHPDGKIYIYPLNDNARNVVTVSDTSKQLKLVYSRKADHALIRKTPVEIISNGTKIKVKDHKFDLTPGLVSKLVTLRQPNRYTIKEHQIESTIDRLTDEKSLSSPSSFPSAIDDVKTGKGIVKTVADTAKRLSLLIGSVNAGNTSKQVINEIVQIADDLLNSGSISQAEHKIIHNITFG